MSKRDSNTQPLKEAIARMLKAYRMDSKMDELDVMAAWDKVMEPSIAKRTQSLKIREGVLYVKLTSSTLREELSYHKEKLIERLNEATGKETVKDIVLA